MYRLRSLETTGALALAGIVSVALVAVFLFVQRVRVLWPFTVDDTYITLQYAKHLAAGHGPSWNVGGPRAEGYTTVLWMLLLSLVEWFGSDGVLGAKLLSVVFTALAIGLSSVLAAALCGVPRQAVRVFAGAIPLALGASYWKLSIHAVSGMETTFTAALVTGLALAFVRFGDRPTRLHARAVAVLGLCLTLARPEAALFAVVGWVAVYTSADAAARRVLLRSTVGLAVAPGAAYFVARYAWFGLPFPLPFYIKAAGHGGFAGAAEVAAFIADFLRDRPYALALMVVAIAARPRRTLPVLLSALALALFFLVPSHIMGFESRYLMPIVPVMFALAGAGGALLFEKIRVRIARRALAVTLELVCWAALVLAAIAPFPEGFDASAAHWRAYGQGLREAHLALAADLRDYAPLAQHRRIALLDVGAVAYASDWNVLDTYGLNDARVALSRRTDIAYIFESAPDIVVLVSEQPDAWVPVFDWEVPIAAEALQQGFVRIKSYPFEADYHLELYARDGTQLAEALRSGPRGRIATTAQPQ